MVKEIRIFGAALDALSSFERVNLKQAYLNHLRNEKLMREGFKDPYDFVKTHIQRSLTLNSRMKWVGKINIPSWLTPKPRIGDTPGLSTDKINKFLERNGCWKYALMIADYINTYVYPDMPVMIGVEVGGCFEREQY